MGADGSERKRAFLWAFRFPGQIAPAAALRNAAGVDPLPPAVAIDLLLEREPDVLGDPLGSDVVRMDDGDQPAQPQLFTREVPAGRRGLGRQAPALERATDVIADLDLGDTLDLLGREAAIADELAGLPELDDPQPEAQLLVTQAAMGESCQPSDELRGPAVDGDRE
jgi:hypothetical protein